MSLKISKPDKDIINFGKYKGHFFNRILIEDPCYIDWCIRNTDQFDYLSKDMKDAIDMDCREVEEDYWSEMDTEIY